VAIFTFLIIMPFWQRVYFTEVATLLFINIILTVSFYIIVQTGEWSLAHVVMMGVGAYSSALFTSRLGIPVFASIPIAALVAAGIGRLISYPLVRMTGFGFFIGSFAAGEAIRLAWTRIRDPFGGVRGLINIPYPETISVAGIAVDFSRTTPYYLMTLGAMAACLFVMYRMDTSRLGDNFRAIHSDPNLAASMGIDVTSYRNTAFMIGSFFAGLAGALLVHRLGAVDPHGFSLTTMLYLLVWVVVGGTSNFISPIIGVCVMTAVFEGARGLAEWRPFLFGAILIAVLVFAPGGLGGLITKIQERFQQPRSPTKIQAAAT
jgi:branched-chain amino acid transport system permease protein